MLYLFLFFFFFSPSLELGLRPKELPHYLGEVLLKASIILPRFSHRSSRAWVLKLPTGLITEYCPQSLAVSQAQLGDSRPKYAIEKQVV